MLTALQIQSILADAGIRTGDTVVVHSSLRTIGPVEGGADGVIDALLNTVGPRGTIAMPTFNYSSPPVLPWYDPATTPSRTGILCEVFRKRAGAKRSLNPTHSVAVSGPDADAIIAAHLQRDTMGVDSPLDRLAQRGGWVLLLGVTNTSNSTIHIGESHAGVKKYAEYGSDNRERKVKMPDGSIYTYRIEPSASCSASFNAVELPLRRAGQIRDFRIGQGPGLLMKGLAVIDAVKSLIAEEACSLFCTNPQCRWCVGARRIAVGAGV